MNISVKDRNKTTLQKQYVPRCRYTMCIHFFYLPARLKGCCRVICQCQCHCWSMLTLRQKAKHKTEHEPDVWRTCGPECFATRTRWRCTCSTTSRISIKWYRDQGTDPISNKISYQKISQSLESARSDVESLVPLWNLTSVSIAVLLRRLPYFRPIGKF